MRLEVLGSGWSPKHTAATRTALKSLEGAVSAAAPSAEVWEAYSGWLEALLRREALPEVLPRRLRKRALRVCQSAHSSGHASEAVYLRWAYMRMTKAEARALHATRSSPLPISPHLAPPRPRAAELHGDASNCI